MRKLFQKLFQTTSWKVALKLPNVVTALRDGRRSQLRCSFLEIYRAIVSNREHVPGIVVAVAVGVIGLDVSWISQPNMSTREIALIVSGSFIVVLISSIVSAQWALRIMAPSDYAKTSLGGRSASEILQVISHRILHLCKDSLRIVAAYQNSIAKLSRDPGNGEKYSKALNLLVKKLGAQHALRLRVQSMLELASRELNIPLRRLRDLLVNFDPRVHKAYTAKFVHNAGTLRELPESDPKRPYLEAENEHIRRSAERTIESVKGIMEYTALLPKILHIATVPSTSQASKEFARAVSFVAKNTLEVTKARAENWKEKLQDGVAALSFVVRAQYVHSGFDLNQLCLQACISEPALRTVLHNLGEMGLQAFGDLNNPDNALYALNSMRLLSTLENIVTREIDADRDILVRGFSAEYDYWRYGSASPNPKFLLVTHGFSTAVREVFKRGIKCPADTDIFVVASGRNGAVDSKLMRYSLMEVPDHRRFRNITAGDEESLLSFLIDATDVMLVLGAECIDGKGRVLHPRGLQLDRLRQRLTNQRFRVVVVAEGFKCYSDLVAIPWSYRYHLDRIKIYKPDWTDVIVTSNTRERERRGENGASVIPVQDRRVVRDRRGPDTFLQKGLVVRRRHGSLMQPNLPFWFGGQRPSFPVSKPS